jgi:hypothetical protein
MSHFRKDTLVALQDDVDLSASDYSSRCLRAYGVDLTTTSSTKDQTDNSASSMESYKRFENHVDIPESIITILPEEASHQNASRHTKHSSERLTAASAAED